jgi:hypothetical protein
MSNRKTLTDKGVVALKPRAARYAFPDPELRGHYVRVTPTGSKSFAAVARANNKQFWTTIGSADAMSIDDACTGKDDPTARARGSAGGGGQGRDIRQRGRQLAQASRRGQQVALEP